MPRHEVLRAFHPDRDEAGAATAALDPSSSEDPHLHSYLSGFWGIARIAPPGDRDACEVLLRAELEGRGEAIAELARIPIIDGTRPVRLEEPAASADPFVAI